MSFSYGAGLNPPIDYVRLLIPDTNPLRYAFQDSELMAFYAIQQNTFQSSQFWSYPGGAYLPSSPVSYFRVAAIALGVLASNGAKLSAITQILDVKLDASKAAVMFRDQAKYYRDVDDDSGAFVIIEQCQNGWAYKDRWIKQMMRNQL